MQRDARVPRGGSPTGRGAGPAAAGAAVLALAVSQLSGCAQWSAPGASSARPAPPISDASLTGVAALSPSNAWTVGETTNFTGVIAHWNGSTWRRVATPAGTLGLTSVSASSPGDAWAVGYDSLGEALSIHWNGTAWRPVQVPLRFGDLHAVADGTPRDAWAVGESGSGRALALHWNGTAWQQTPLPAGSAAGSVLFGVTSLSPNDAWAVGESGSGGALALHWNGTAWQQTAYPGRLTAYLSAVSTLSPDDVWAAGQDNGHPVVAHWNGMAWREMAVPAPGIGGYLSGIAATPAGDVWAAGQTGDRNALIEHWNGTAWRQVPSGTTANTGMTSIVGTQLYQVGAAGSRVWAVGTGRADTDPVILAWHGTAWKKLTLPVTGIRRRSPPGLRGQDGSSPPAAGGVPGGEVPEAWNVLFFSSALSGTSGRARGPSSGKPVGEVSHISHSNLPGYTLSTYRRVDARFVPVLECGTPTKTFSPGWSPSRERESPGRMAGPRASAGA